MTDTSGPCPLIYVRIVQHHLIAVEAVDNKINILCFYIIADYRHQYITIFFNAFIQRRISGGATLLGLYVFRLYFSINCTITS